MSVYQGAYDAIRSRLGNCDIESAVRDVLQQLDFNRMYNAVYSIEIEYMRPSVLYRPTLSQVNGQWHAVYGEVIGHGDTPDAAMRSFDVAWHRRLT